MEPGQRNRILIVLFLGVLMGALDIAIVGPALPAIQHHFGVSDRLLTWMFSSYVLFNLIGTPLMARLADLFGRRQIYIVDVTLFALGSLIVFAAPTFTVVIIGRAIQGFGAGGILVGAVADSQGGGVSGYSSAFLATGVLAVFLVMLAIGLKNRRAEIQTVHDQTG